MPRTDPEDKTPIGPTASDRSAREAARAERHRDATHEEWRSVTHSDLWIPQEERALYKKALTTLNAAGIPYVVAGAYGIYAHTGIYRETKDLDLLVEPQHVDPAMHHFREAGLVTRLEQPVWLAKATSEPHFVDVIFGIGNGLGVIDSDWYRYSTPGILAATPVRIAPAEELLWHRLFISERHRQDMADIVHLIVCKGTALDWRRILQRTGEHWPLLLAQAQMFNYVYPEIRSGIPGWVWDDLLSRAAADRHRRRTDERVTRGTLVSRFSFSIDVHEWEFRDLGAEAERGMEQLPIIREIAFSDVWQHLSQSALDYRARYR